MVAALTEVNPFTRADLEAVVQLLRAAARTEIMPRFRRLGPGAVRSKGGRLDLVTDADEAAEHFITGGLTRLFPGCLVVGEEQAAREPTLIARLAAAKLAFTVDPIDGTANYAAGLPLFGVMAAAVSHGRTVAAAILDPVVDSCSCALLGQGAWEEPCSGGAHGLRMCGPLAVQDMAGMASWRFLPPALRRRALDGLTCVAQVWDHRCAAHEYRAMAAGHSGFSVFYRLMPWDHLPGVLLAQEAGGFAAKYDGSPYVPGETEGGLIVAPSQSCWAALRRTLFGESTGRITA